MEIKNMIEEILKNDKVDRFHIEYWHQSEEKDVNECLVKIDMEKDYM